MNKVTWINRFLNESDLTAIRSAVAEAEKTTSGEIVPMIVKSSSTTGHVFPILALFFVALNGWLLGYEWLALIVSAGLIGLAYFLSRSSFFQRLLTTREDQEIQVHRRAELEFLELGLDKTAGKTGILIFVSLLEHRIVVLADKAINEKVAKETWSELVSELTTAIKAHQVHDGFIKAVHHCAEILKPHFPIHPNDLNEIRDHLVVKE